MTAVSVLLPGLATSDDPQVLVAGSIQALYDDADDLTRQAGELVTLAEDVRRRTVETWFGRGAERWAELRPQLADAIEASAWAYDLAAAALRAHAGVIIRARAVAMVAVLLWRGALAEESRSATVGLACVPTTPRLGVPQTTPPLGVPQATPRLGEVRGVTTPPGTWAMPAPVPGAAGGVSADPTGLRTLAETVLRLARDDVAAHAAQVGTVLDQLCEGMPDGEFRLSDVGAGLVDWAAGLWHLAGLGSPIRCALDYEAALADTRSLYDDLATTVRTLADDPHEANRLLLDSQTWHDEPGRWVGRMAPDALLSAVAGVGVVTRGASRLGAAFRALEDLRPTPVPAPTPRVWTSTDPLVGELATWLDEQIPGVVRGVNERVPTLYGRRQEIDIDLGTVVIEVKTGQAQKLGVQLEAIAAKTGRVTIAYAPDLPARAWHELATRGLAVARDKTELLQLIREYR